LALSVFDLAENVTRYEAWFKNNRFAFESELAAVKRILPAGVGFEVGIGTGIFAREIGICMGNDPSMAMLALARKRRILVCNGTGERLPFHDGCFDFMLMVTTICFLDDPNIVLRECRRVVKPNGAVVVGFVNGESPVGKSYREKSNRSVFFRKATFYTVDQVEKMLVDTGFEIDGTCQTLFGTTDALAAPQTPRDGAGEGSFVVIRGRRIEQRGGFHEKTTT
jgi:ubiquinone/menaquinone biosynthesis C-methylase UbiE